MSEIENNLKVHNAVERVCKLLGDVSTEQVWSKQRTYKVATARQLVMWYLFRVCEMGYNEIGRAMGKNHATIMWGVKQIDNILEIGRDYDRRIIDAANELKNGKEQETYKC